jgi:hypothetical protein
MLHLLPPRALACAGVGLRYCYNRCKGAHLVVHVCLPCGHLCVAQHAGVLHLNEQAQALNELLCERAHALALTVIHVKLGMLLGVLFQCYRGGGLGVESMIDVAAAAMSLEGGAWCLREAEWGPGVTAADADMAMDGPLQAVRIHHSDVGVWRQMWMRRQRRGSR